MMVKSLELVLHSSGNYDDFTHICASDLTLACFEVFLISLGLLYVCMYVCMYVVCM